MKKTDGLSFKPKVLVVEDTLIALKMAQMTLEEKGCEVVCATSGEEALEKMDSSFNFVLMDIGLPGIDGFETAKRIRKMGKKLYSIPIVVLTGHSDTKKYIEISKEIGLNGFLSKPFTLDMCNLLLNKFIFYKNDSNEFLIV